MYSGERYLMGTVRSSVQKYESACIYPLQPHSNSTDVSAVFQFLGEVDTSEAVMMDLRRRQGWSGTIFFRGQESASRYTLDCPRPG